MPQKRLMRLLFIREFFNYEQIVCSTNEEVVNSAIRALQCDFTGPVNEIALNSS